MPRKKTLFPRQQKIRLRPISKNESALFASELFLLAIPEMVL